MFLLIASIFTLGVAWSAAKRHTGKGANAVGLNVVARSLGSACILGALLAWLGPRAVWQTVHTVAWLGVVAAVCYWMATFGQFRVVHLGHLGTSSTIVRCSMLIPTMVAIVLYGELAHLPALGRTARGLGIALTALALVGYGLTTPRTRSGSDRGPSPHWARWVVLTFVSQGAWEVCMQCAGRLTDDASRLVFIGGVFACAALFGWVWAGTHQCIGRREWVGGAVIGLFGCSTTVMRIFALKYVPGHIVFPVSSVGSVLLVQAIGCVFWRERLTRGQTVSFVCAAVGILLLALRW